MNDDRTQQIHQLLDKLAEDVLAMDASEMVRDDQTKQPLSNGRVIADLVRAYTNLATLHAREYRSKPEPASKPKMEPFPKVDN